MRISAALIGAMVAGAGLVALVPAIAADKPVLSMPLDCTVGKDCWVQNLVDFDPGPGKSDPFCGPASFDTHKGTDFRVLTTAELKRGIEIRSLADGKIVALRNNMADHLVEGPADVAKIKNKECGNGVMVEHDGGWTTQICHLAKGSVRVSKGDLVQRGTVVGLMGLSGHTTFPHVHVTVRKGKSVVDPLTGRDQSSGCVEGAADLSASLWDADAKKQVIGASSEILKTGFSSKTINSSAVMKDEVTQASAEGPLIFYAYLTNLRKGDRVDLVINGPKGVYAASRGEPLKSAKAVWTMYTGRRSKPPSGTYRGTATLIRDGKVASIVDDVEVNF